MDVYRWIEAVFLLYIQSIFLRLYPWETLTYTTLHYTTLFPLQASAASTDRQREREKEREEEERRKTRHSTELMTTKCFLHGPPDRSWAVAHAATRNNIITTSFLLSRVASTLRRCWGSSGMRGDGMALRAMLASILPPLDTPYGLLTISGYACSGVIILFSGFSVVLARNFFLCGPEVFLCSSLLDSSLYQALNCSIEFNARMLGLNVRKYWNRSCWI